MKAPYITREKRTGYDKDYHILDLRWQIFLREAMKALRINKLLEVLFVTNKGK